MISFDDLGNLGRLGNQMFQYASLRGIAHNHGYDYCLPSEDVMMARNIIIFDYFKIPDAPRQRTNFLKIRECSFKLDENLWDNCPDNVNLHGYFQTEKYFKCIEKQIRESFIFVDEVKEVSEKIFKSNFENNEVISIHLRRGDYLTTLNHPVQPIDYYSKSLSYFPQNIPVMIFSDDIEWCKEQKLFKGNRFIFSENNKNIVDLCLQSLCKYHIIANSSFSWWGAWLANSEKVIAPKNWFGGSYINYNTEDLYLPHWEII